MLVKTTIDEEVTEVLYNIVGECICDECGKKFYKETVSFDSDDEDEAMNEFLKGDFLLCPDCKKRMQKIMERQMSIF